MQVTRQRLCHWLTSLMFPFRVFPIVAFVFYIIYSLAWSIWRRGYYSWKLEMFGGVMMLGSATCVLVLTISAFIHLLLRRFGRAGQDFGLAVLSAYVGYLCVPNFVIA